MTHRPGGRPRRVSAYACARATDVHVDEHTGYLIGTLIPSAGDGKRRQRGRVDR